jgi:NAD-dependent DNA ligase/DNA polymerase/3'-5' exonuclease PolX
MEVLLPYSFFLYTKYIMRGGTMKGKFIIESSSTERKPVGRLRRPTRKRRIIIDSSSSLLAVTPPKTKKRKNAKATPEVKRELTKKKRFIIVSSTPEIKEKIETQMVEKKGEHKTDLKVSPDIKPMASQVHPLPSGRLNEKFIELMEKLADIMLKQGEPFRARAYQKAQETIMAFPDDILAAEQLSGKPGIGSTIMDKLAEYVQTGTLKVLEREKNNPINILADVYGIGPKKAKELVDNGITTIAQLRENTQMLNDVQKVGLRYYEDILKRIPRSEIEEYESIFDTNFMFATLLKESNDDPRFEVVGSYRRGAQNSGDIDVIITSNNPKVFVRFIDTLINQKIILEVLSRGPTKCLVIAKIPSSDSARRVDFLYTTPEEYPFSVLYFTGSKIFNTVMRHQALQMGLTMNEHGLYKMEGKKKGEKVDHTFKDEKDIFNYLHMAYKTPVERTDGRAVVIKQKSPSIEAAPKGPAAEIDAVVESEDEAENIVIDKTTAALIDTFKANGISHLQTLNENQLTSMLNLANVLYRNAQPIMTDNQYDILQDFIATKYPANKDVRKIGAPVERNKAVLPYFMGSMDKIKPDTHALANWLVKYKGPYVLSCKLDGVSGLYTTEGVVPKLYTRGDGKVGQDVSHLIPHLRLPKTKGVVIRGEFIIPKEVFIAKYKTTFANPRNMVSGLVNQKTINAAVSDLHFVAYEVIIPDKKPSAQMEFLSTLDVETVLYKVETSLTNEMLSQTLVDWRQNYSYEIDGVIVVNDAKYDRREGNPEHAFAFKMVLSDQIAEAMVVDVIWTPSKDGYLKPRVQIEPINLGGVRIEYATGFNGAFISDNKIGVGAVVELIRSGDVIPHIRKVTVSADQAKMPNVPYKWNDTHVDIMLENMESDETVREKNITGFFKGIEVDGLGTGNVARIIQAGFDTVPKIIKMTIDDFLHVEGFKKTMATKIYNGIREKLGAAPLVAIMSASNIFGRGFSDKRMELIIESHPTILVSKEPAGGKVARIAEIKGMSTKTAEAFVEKIPAFIEFIHETGLDDKLVPDKKAVVDESHPLYGKSVVMTGFRDADLQDKLKNVGAKLGSSVSKNTFIVLVKDKEDETGKAADARKLGINIMTPDEFRAKYF